METLSLELPAMYGDHHVVEVRRLLLEMPGVTDVYASSSFQVVEVAFEPDKADADAVKARLDEAGYLGELPIPAEAGIRASGRRDGLGEYRYRRHATDAEAGDAVAFSQTVPYSGRPLWPCPGMEPLKVIDEGEGLNGEGT